MNAEATIKLTKPFHQNFHQGNMMSDKTSPNGYVQFFLQWNMKQSPKEVFIKRVFIR